MAEGWEYSVPSMPDPTYGQADTDDAMLENFFSRPIKIAEYSWATGTTLFETFNPWSLFFENDRVINRIANFNLLRAKLKVRIMINGNGFYYGRAIASYTPLHTFDQMTQDRAFFIQDVVAASQRPHVYLDPTNSLGGDLCLPFVWHKNALNIPEAEWRSMGDMHIHELQNLKHANGATTPITISVMAWAEEVSLSIPTQQDPGGLVPQAGPDEYGDGIVSRPAAIVAKAAGALSTIPILGAYARATEIAANAVNGVAKLWGYSRPVMTETSIPFSPHLIGNLANTSVTDQSTKLALDLKQEVTIDPRTMGLSDTDEMTIKSVATRESYLTSFGWQVTSPTGSLLWNTTVTPVTWAELGTELHFPACCFASLPFRFWRGTMKYRFQIVASSFHKGRLQISFDPRVTGVGEFNTQYVYLIDLAKERDFTVEVGWGQEYPSLAHGRPGDTALPYSVFPFPIPTAPVRNGVLSVRVLNDLTSPNSVVNNDVEINVFVSAGDDFEVYIPDAEILDNYTIFNPAPVIPALKSNEPFLNIPYGPIEEDEELDPQSGEETQPDADLTIRESEPMKLDPSVTLAPTPTQTNHFDSVFFGDPIVSFRQVLKRYQLHSAVAKAFTVNSFTTVVANDFPFYRGLNANGIHTSVDGPYNYCNNTFINYVTCAYTCRRGGLRWKAIKHGANNDPSTLMTVKRNTVLFGSGYSEGNTNVLTLTASNRDERARQAYLAYPSLFDGGAATVTGQNPVLEYELPYYNNGRFSFAKQSNQTVTQTIYDHYHTLTMLWYSAATNTPLVSRMVSTGEDFTVNFYTGPPVMYFVQKGDDPAAVA